MCGIVGLRLKSEALEPRLGALVVPMLTALASRGPDSTGVAFYESRPPGGPTRYSLSALGHEPDWPSAAARVERVLGRGVTLRGRERAGVLETEAGAGEVLAAVAAAEPSLRLVGQGRSIEVLKDLGPAGEVCARYGVSERSGRQAVGHTRMATESAVTIEHSHPFAVAPDLCLVHNGSFSNHSSIRRNLLAEGVGFDTDNDSEVAARFVATCMREGDDLETGLGRVLKVFDGFFTLLVVSGDGMAVVRDSFACKPMVVAETDSYVAVASEYVALAGLPGISRAEVFEPAPESVYWWAS